MKRTLVSLFALHFVVGALLLTAHPSRLHAGEGAAPTPSAPAAKASAGSTSQFTKPNPKAALLVMKALKVFK
ncbi:MAG: hypothetical protein ACYTGH_17330, partial [Planctomycetota bacterium]